MILVAAGIGITPALSAIDAYRDSRRINLIWAVRDASMLVFFLRNAKLDEKGLNLIFYTGKDPLPDIIENNNGHKNNTTNNNGGSSSLSSLPQHVKIIKGRPNLSFVIPNIIEFVDKGGINWKKNAASSSSSPLQNQPMSMSDRMTDTETNATTDNDVAPRDLETGGVGIRKEGDSWEEDNQYGHFFEDDDDDENEEWIRPLIPTTANLVSSGTTSSPPPPPGSPNDGSPALTCTNTKGSSLALTTLLDDIEEKIPSSANEEIIFRTSSMSDLSGGWKDTWRIASSMPTVWNENKQVDTRHYVKTIMDNDHLETVRRLSFGSYLFFSFYILTLPTRLLSMRSIMRYRYSYIHVLSSLSRTRPCLLPFT